MAVNIGIIGLGTVGGGAYEILSRRIKIISSRVGSDVVIKKVCDKRESVRESLGISKDIWTTDYRDIINDKDISLVVELTGDSVLAYEIISESFKKSKHIVTANKALLATRWKDIFEMAHKYHRLIYFEASVASGIPVIQGINEGLAANEISKIVGILNGTSNYILTKMSIESVSFEKALKAAVKAGFAEPDSSFDINGKDAAHKICVLANVIFERPVRFDDIYCEGIGDIQLEDIEFSRDMFKLNMKLLAVIKRHSGGVEVRVHPALLWDDDMLSSVNYENNGIVIKGDAVGEIMFYGKGAGRYPAASAVVSDIIYLAQKINYNIAGDIPYIHTDTTGTLNIIPMDELKFQYYVRFTTVDKPGVLSKISGILSEFNVSIDSLHQKIHSEKEGVPIVVITHSALEGNLKKALYGIDRLDIIKSKSVFIRIESEKER